MPARHRVQDSTAATSVMSIRIGEPRHIRWQCPNCTWFRERTNSEQWERKVFTHPIYGNVTNYEAFERDVEHHDCELTRERRIHHGFDTTTIHDPYVYDKKKDKKRGRTYETFDDRIYES